jgi:hypothetical protein
VGIVKVPVAFKIGQLPILIQCGQYCFMFSRFPLLDGRFISGRNFSQITSGQLVILKDDGLLVGGMIRKLQ